MFDLLQYQLCIYAVTIIIIGYYKNISCIHEQNKYNNFADKRCCCKINNFSDVVSNIFFVIVPIYYHSDFYIKIGMILVCLGSMYFHYNPTIGTLYYDRLPMSFIFGLILYKTFDSVALGILSVLSVVYWKYTMDLVPYSVIQFSPMLIYLEYDCGMRTVVLYYILAKICELNDKTIFNLTNKIISGHTLKHLFASFAVQYIKPIPCQ